MRNTNDASDKTFLLSGFLSLFVAFLNLGLFFTHFYGDTATYFAAGLSRIIQFDDWPILFISCLRARNS